MLASPELIAAKAAPEPAFGEAALAKARAHDAVVLCQTLRKDFAFAVDLLTTHNARSGAGRTLVRCFGSLVEALSDSMRTLAVLSCEFHGKDYNRFLNAKSTERGAAYQNRIYHSYRIIHEALPKSPLARVPDERWDRLHSCLAIRNRVVHPHCAADLEVTDAEIMLIADVAVEFVRDFDVFAQWHSQKQQKLGWEASGQRKREFRKTGRNESCPCGSQRKYKDCCIAAQWAA